MTKYTPIPNEIIHNGNLNERQFHTYCLITEQCWNPDTGSFEWTEPASMSELSKVFNKPRTTLLDHFFALRTIGVIEIYKISDIVVSLIPTQSVGQPYKVSASRPITIQYSSIKKEDSLIELKEENDGQPTPVGQPTLYADIAEFLRTQGVGEPTRSRIACSGKSLDHVQHWFKYIEIKGHPVSHAIAALRDDLPKPKYCLICGGIDGKHNYVNFAGCPRMLRPDLDHMTDEKITEFLTEVEQ